jgi:hypothetical protein
VSTPEPTKRARKARQRLEDQDGSFDVWTGPGAFQPLTEEQVQAVREFTRQYQQGTVSITPSPYDSPQKEKDV